jgi:glycogen debranching enzyme
MDQHTDDFSITAQVSLAERRFLTLKHGDTFGVFDQSGQMTAGPGNTVGLYHRDTRYLSEFEALLGGRPPILLSSTLRDDNATLTCDLTNPDLVPAPGRPDIHVTHDLVHIRRSRFLWRAVMHERIMVRNFDVVPHKLALELRFGADFADLFEVRGMRRARHGQHEPATLRENAVTLSYVGLDARRRSTTLRFFPAPDRLNEGRAIFDLDLPPARRAVVYVEIACDTAESAKSVPRNFIACMIEQRRWTRVQSARAAAIETSNSRFNEAMQRAISDLTMLVTELPTGPYPYAGVPWFSTEFGRDAIITALNVLWMDPSIALGVLRYLAENQATETNPASDAEPGKILHEVRNGEMADLGEVPFRRYYGSVDSTPLFVMLAGAYLDRTGDVAALRGLWPNIMAALGWIDAQSDKDPDGFVAYFRQTPEGLANQGWKDSFDSVSHADGSLAEGPIALCEVQGYVFAARRAAARVAAAMGDTASAARLESQAETLREAFERVFWCEQLGTYAIALDGKRQRCDIRASNAGHLLLTGIAGPLRAARVAEGLMEPRFFTGWGIRTLASGEARYNPMSYHNGSVWPHDNALIAMGMGRHGMKDHAAKLFESFFDAALYIDLRRLPELFCGFSRRRGQGPTFYPVACTPQAWAATALHAHLAACLGLQFDPDGCNVIFDRPRLPPFLDEVTLHNLSLGEARISVLLRRMGNEVAMNVLERTGAIHAVMRS